MHLTLAATNRHYVLHLLVTFAVIATVSSAIITFAAVVVSVTILTVLTIVSPPFFPNTPDYSSPLPSQVKRPPEAEVNYEYMLSVMLAAGASGCARADGYVEFTLATLNPKSALKQMAVAS
eukprot:2285027-Pleurochrysis_carterae.AAC.1